jgi:hypothetical protein
MTADDAYNHRLAFRSKSAFVEGGRSLRESIGRRAGKPFGARCEERKYFTNGEREARIAFFAFGES